MAMASAKAMHFGAGHVLLDTTISMHLQLLPTVQLLLQIGHAFLDTMMFMHLQPLPVIKLLLQI